tara:strand:- start:770 stop:988 length:219 start_codon:yes stop_codon:yes gene_type:complete
MLTGGDRHEKNNNNDCKDSQVRSKKLGASHGAIIRLAVKRNRVKRNRRQRGGTRPMMMTIRISQLTNKKLIS